LRFDETYKAEYAAKVNASDYVQAPCQTEANDDLTRPDQNESKRLTTEFLVGHGIFLVSSRGASPVSQTAISAHSSTERVARGPLMFVRTQPGHIELRAIPSVWSAPANTIASPFSANFDKQ
jgi:hypothetical protein